MRSTDMRRASLRVASAALLVLAARLAFAGCLRPYWEEVDFVASPANRLAAATLDGDARPDIAGNDAASVFVVMNDGSGGFGAPVTVYSGTVRGAVLAEDLNGDAKVDLVFAGASAIVMLPGNGDGTFGTAVSSAIDIVPTHIDIARFDQGNTPDVIALDPAAAQLVLYTNDGTGVLQEAARMTTAAKAQTLTAADLDADASIDALVGHENANYTAFYGAGNGTFGSGVNIRGSYHPPAAIRAVDMDGNGLPDLVAIGMYNIGIMRNLGGRTFGDPYVRGPAYLTRDLEVRDFTGDGVPDALNTNSDCTFRTFTGSGLGTLTYYTDTPPCFYLASASDVASADFDGDGRPDAAVSRVQPSAPSGNVPGFRIYRNRCGDGTIVVTPAATVVTVGDPVELRMRIAPPFDTEPLFHASGTATLLKGETVVTTLPLSGIGDVNFVVNGLSLGTHEFVVQYSGDAQYGPLQSAPVPVRMTGDTTTTALSIDPVAPQYRDPIRITAAVTSSTGSVPGGSVEILIDGKAPWGCSAPCTAPNVVVGAPSTMGTHSVTARYRGDANHPPSPIAAMTYVVQKKQVTVTGTTWAQAGQAFDFSTRIHGSNDSAAADPSGTVTVAHEGTVFGTATIDPSYGWSHIPVPALAAGRYTFRVSYSGDAHYAALETLLPLVVFPGGVESIEARGTSGGVMVSWREPTSYGVRRRIAGQPGATLYACCAPYNPTFDTAPQPGTVYLYQLVNIYTTPVTVHATDVAQRISFSDDPLLSGMTVHAHHLQEIVAGTNTMRAAAGLTAIPSSAFTHGTVVTAAHVNTIRTAIDDARGILGANVFPWAATVTPGTIIRAAHIQELREAIR
jgi:Bacterial Ig-like domain (group 3)/FG-GAP-like repeat